MNVKRTSFMMCLVCLMLASTLAAQDDDIAVVRKDNVVRLASPSVSAEFDVAHWVATGELILAAGPVNNTNKATPGPAPAPYAQAVVWEKGIEQLGASATICDGITFVNGPQWVANKPALVLWTIRIPNPSRRLLSEFSRDLTLQLWVDWNENKVWEKRERVIEQTLNFADLLPSSAPYIEIQYMTSFVVPRITHFAGGYGVTKYEAKVWVRGGLTYDDPDASPVGETLFGEYEDYLLNWFEIQTGTKTKG
ncbi:MAG: hypothetical protein C4574_02970 [Candidatus Latescibacterota bacterium]|jgi:hypothetical protein|nr:MAG: hypothetical protein C4574_02970 [Candidatus Latescibacterota bacterium]